MKRAIILTDGLLATANAKTAHGLIRESERFTITGVVDHAHAGKDAGEVLDGIHRNIPVFPSVAAAMAVEPAYCIVGVATHGGIFPESMLEIIKSAIQHRLSIINGLHDCLSERPDIRDLAAACGVELIDIRRPKKRQELHFWTGEVRQIPVPVIAVLGTDCALGKRTTARLVMNACRKAGIRAELIYTGQTGWLQGGKYGFVLDSTLNDFVSGELEHALLTCYREVRPDLMLIEGQAALRNPSGPCGSEFLVSGNARSVILVHAPKRTYFDHEAHLGRIPTLESEIALIRMYGSAVIALALNTEGCTREEAQEFVRVYEHRLNVPVLLPLEEGCDKIIPLIHQLISHEN